MTRDPRFHRTPISPSIHPRRQLKLKRQISVEPDSDGGDSGELTPPKQLDLGHSMGYKTNHSNPFYGDMWI